MNCELIILSAAQKERSTPLPAAAPYNTSVQAARQQGGFRPAAQSDQYNQ